MTAPRRGVRDLPIFWKLLLPFVVLLAVIGTTGAFVIVHDLGAQRRSALHEQLTLRLVEARAAVHDRELDLGEAATYASNLEGISDAVKRHDAAGADALLQSVTALKPA